MSRSVRRVAVAVWVGLSAIQIVVWGLISFLGGQLVAPWFLWTVVIGGIVVGALHLLTRSEKSAQEKSA